VLVILASSVLLLGCSDTPTSSANCSAVLSDTARFDTHEPSATNLSNGYRTFFWIKNLNSLCVAAPEAKNRVSFEVATLGSEPISLFLTGKVQPALGYQPYRVDLLQTSVHTYTGSISNIGLEQGSSDGLHGYAGIQLEATFLSRGGGGRGPRVRERFLGFDRDQLEV
jgi:hypothetical protein